MDGVNGIIVKAIDGFYFVLCGEIEYFCKSRKKFRFNGLEPCVGDKVYIKIIDELKNEGVIEKIYRRTSNFIRPQLSNATQVFIVLSYLEPKINFEFLNKLILNFEFIGLNIIIVINKCELHSPDDDNKLKNMFYKFPYEVLFVSVKENLNINLIKNMLSGNISCFCGPSGVGKSSLLNLILSKKIMETSDLSYKIKRGKHTTRFSQLIYLKECDGYIIDTPGFSSVEIIQKIDKNTLKDYFIDFNEYKNCKFRGCSHTKNEDGCNVKIAVENGNINKNRYDFYLKLYEKFKEKKR